MTERVLPADVRRHLPHFGLLLLINVVWGFNVIAMKLAVSEIPPLFATAIRFLMVLGVSLPWLRILPGRMGRLLLLGLLFGALHFGAMFWAMQLAHDAGVIAVLTQVGVPMSVLMAMLVLREQVSVQHWVGILLTFAGVVVIGFDPRVMEYLAAVALVMFVGFAYAVSALLMRSLTGVKPMELQAWVALVSVPSLLLLSHVFGESGWTPAAEASWWAWGALIYSACAASLIGHVGMFYLLQRYPVSQITPFTLLVPLVAMAAGVLFLDDVLTPLIVIGALVTILGVLVITRGNGAGRG